MKKKKRYTVVFSELAKKQIHTLPPKVKKELDEAITNIKKNPTKAPNSMNLSSKPNPEELRRWMSKVKPETIDLVLEYLKTKDCLNKEGKKLAHAFWYNYIKEE